MKKFALLAGVALMALSSVAFVWQGITGSTWSLLAVPVYMGFAVMFWRSASRSFKCSA